MKEKITSEPEKETTENKRISEQNNPDSKKNIEYPNMPSENILILKKLFRHRKPLLLITVITAVITYLVCFFITPSFKSVAFVYPANLSVYSEESQTEQLLQYMNSNEVRLYLFKKYNLANHYKIDTTKKLYPFVYDGIYEKKISISQTKYESVEIKAEDRDADTARMLVTGIIEATNWLIEKEHAEKYLEAVKNARIYLDYKRHEVDSTQKLMNKLNEEYKLLNVGIQLKDLAKSQYKMSSGNSGSDFLKIADQLKAIDKEGNSITTLISDINNYAIEYNKLNVYLDDQIRGWAWANNDYQKKLGEYRQKTTFTVLASKPTRPVVASWPKKSIVALVSCLAVLLLASCYFVFIDKIKAAYEQIASEE